MKVLIVGDTRETVDHIPLCLRLRWPSVNIVFANTGSKGVEMVKTEDPDFIMTEFSLTDIRCLDLVKGIRAFSDTPLTVLIGDSTELDRAEVLEAGADDYIRKPFAISDVLAKTNALLRRAQGNSLRSDQSYFVNGNLEINLAEREVLVSGKPIRLTQIENSLLSQLVRNEGRVITHRALLENVWGVEFTNDLSLVKDHMYRLRKKLRSRGGNDRMIISQRGVGYKFVPQV